MEKLTITENYNDSYKELKSDLKERYARILCNAIDDAREKAIKQTANVVTDNFLKILEETENLKQEKKSQEKEFFNSEEYQTAQKRLKKVKKDLDSVKNSDKAEIEKEFNKALSTVTTLNITIKNRLKGLDEKINANMQTLKNEMSDCGEDIARIKNDAMNFLQKKIAECVKDYNLELIELNKTFGVEIPKAPELPFDGEVLKLDLPVFLLESETTVKSVTIENKERTLVYSKNESNLIN